MGRQPSVGSPTLRRKRDKKAKDSKWSIGGLVVVAAVVVVLVCLVMISLGIVYQNIQSLRQLLLQTPRNSKGVEMKISAETMSIMKHNMTQTQTEKQTEKQASTAPASSQQKIQENHTTRINEKGVLILDETWSWNEIQRLQSPLNDKTIPWNPNVRHAWIRTHMKSPPPAMLLLTKYGWNHPDRLESHTWGRSIRSRELMEALYEHPWFHPFGYDDIRIGRLPLSSTTHYYIFLDMDTCNDKNYPHHTSQYADVTRNYDQIGQRGRQHGTSHEEQIKDLLSQPIMQLPNAKVVIFDCNGYTRSQAIEDQYWRREWNKDERLVLASLSAHRSQLLPVDFGLSPPPCQKCELSGEKRKKLIRCREDRPFLLTFAGNFRSPVRQHLRQLHNNIDIIISSPEQITLYMNDTDPIAAFKKMATLSQFAAVPRGDNLYSYRFSEVIGCGAIPVVYADGWVLPFERIIDPSTYVVVIPEDQANRTTQILADIPEGTRCQMRKTGLKIYERYFQNSKATLQGVLDSLEHDFQLK